MIYLVNFLLSIVSILGVLLIILDCLSLRYATMYYRFTHIDLAYDTFKPETEYEEQAMLICVFKDIGIALFAGICMLCPFWFIILPIFPLYLAPKKYKSIKFLTGRIVIEILLIAACLVYYAQFYHYK